MIFAKVSVCVTNGQTVELHDLDFSDPRVVRLLAYQTQLVIVVPRIPETAAIIGELMFGPVVDSTLDTSSVGNRNQLADPERVIALGVTQGTLCKRASEIPELTPHLEWLAEHGVSYLGEVCRIIYRKGVSPSGGPQVMTQVRTILEDKLQIPMEFNSAMGDGWRPPYWDDPNFHLLLAKPPDSVVNRWIQRYAGRRQEALNQELLESPTFNEAASTYRDHQNDSIGNGYWGPSHLASFQSMIIKNSGFRAAMLLPSDKNPFRTNQPPSF